MITKRTFAITALMASIVMMTISGTIQMTSAQLLNPSDIPAGSSVVLYLLNDESGSISTLDPDADASTCSSTLDCSEWDLMLEGEVAGLQAAFDIIGFDSVDITLVKIGFGTGVLERCRETITSQADLDSFNACVLSSGKDDDLTNHGGAFQAVADDIPFTPADFHIIDIVTDGITTTGPNPDTARDNAIAAGADRIVGLVIGDDPAEVDPTEVASWTYPPVGGGDIDPDPLPEDDGFVLTVSTFDEFADAFKRKVLTEVDPCILNPDLCVGGEFLPIDSTALFIAGLQSSAIWMLPALAGATGVGAYFIKSRMNKD